MTEADFFAQVWRTSMATEIVPHSPVEQRIMTPIISMWMPWANWVGLGWKTIETRTHRRFRSLAGRRIGIHCSTHWDKKWLEAAGLFLSVEQVACTSHFLRIGGAVCWTALVTEHRLLTIADEPQALIECATPRYGLVLTNVQTIEAIPMKGHQGIWYAGINGDGGKC